MCREPCFLIDMEFFFRDQNEESTPSPLDMVRCPFLRNINEPTNFSFSSSMAFPMPVSCLFSMTVFKNIFYVAIYPSSIGITWCIRLEGIPILVYDVSAYDFVC
jgi:hypothetical protein